LSSTPRLSSTPLVVCGTWDGRSLANIWNEREPLTLPCHDDNARSQSLIWKSRLLNFSPVDWQSGARKNMNLLQSNRETGCSLASNIAPQHCNFDRQIALSNLQPTWTNCKSKFTKDL
jgi:hypothetical protein